MPKPLPRRIAKFTRMVGLEGQTLAYTTPALRKIGNHNAEYWGVRKVPEFEGPCAWFEVEHVHNGSRIVRIIGQVPEPG